MRGQRRANYSGRRRQYKSGPSSDDTLSPIVGPLIKTVRVADLADDCKQYQHAALISDCELLVSFNWVDKSLDSPTILIPGKPPRWTPPITIQRLEEDSGTYFRDKNAARFPEHPLEPAVMAMLDAEPGIGSELDFVGCASTIGNLLRFVRSGDKPFRILVEVINGVTFLTRRENSPRELIDGVRGYGHTFPEAYTTWDAEVKGSASHQRIIRYVFGGLRIAIRFEGDGYLTDTLAQSEPKKNTSVDDLIADFEGDNIASGSTSGTAVAVERRGKLVVQDSVFDLKTRSVWKKHQDILADELPRLWIDQIPNFIVAYHTSGIFEKPEVKDVREDVKRWEKAQNGALAKLAALLHLLKADVGATDSHKLELYHDGSGTLKLCEQLPDVSSALSSRMMALWAESSRDANLEVTGADHDDYTACTGECAYCGQCC